jgi:hypothetical protein
MSKADADLRQYYSLVMRFGTPQDEGVGGPRRSSRWPLRTGVNSIYVALSILDPWPRLGEWAP